MARSIPGKLPVANCRSVWICPGMLPSRLAGSLSIMRVARSWPTAPAILLYAVAKWLCQNSAIFSSSGRCGMDHAEQPALARVVDQRVGGKRLARLRRDADVFRLADLRIVIGRHRLVVEQPVDDGIDGKSRPGRELRGTRAKPQTPKYVFEHTNPYRRETGGASGS